MSRILLEKTKAILEKYGLTPNVVHYGQHFLIEERAIKAFIEECRLTNEELVLEIGPGLGYLTEELAKRAKQVTTIEIDTRFRPVLTHLEKKYKNINVIYKNALELENFNYDVICGALSYNIFEPLLRKFISSNPPLRAVFIVSKKILTESRLQTSLTKLMLEAFFKTRIVDILPAEFFYPRPKFAGALISLQKTEADDFYHFVLRELFLQKDKKLKNALREALVRWYKKAGKELTKKQAKEKLTSLFEYKDIEVSILQATNVFLRKLVEFLK